jgi:hypothetical protein
LGKTPFGKKPAERPAPISGDSSLDDLLLADVSPTRDQQIASGDADPTVPSVAAGPKLEAVQPFGMRQCMVQ